jgi:hypothetical protein
MFVSVALGRLPARCEAQLCLVDMRAMVNDVQPPAISKKQFKRHFSFVTS